MVVFHGKFHRPLDFLASRHLRSKALGYTEKRQVTLAIIHGTPLERGCKIRTYLSLRAVKRMYSKVSWIA